MGGCVTTPVEGKNHGAKAKLERQKKYAMVYRALGDTARNAVIKRSGDLFTNRSLLEIICRFKGLEKCLGLINAFMRLVKEDGTIDHQQEASDQTLERLRHALVKARDHEKMKKMTNHILY